MLEYVKRFFRNLRGLLSKEGIVFILFGPILAGVLTGIIIVPAEMIARVVGFILSLALSAFAILPLLISFLIGLIIGLIQLAVSAFTAVYIVKLARFYLSKDLSLSSLKSAFKRAFKRWFVALKSYIILVIVSALIFILGSILGFIPLGLCLALNIKGAILILAFLVGALTLILFSIFVSVVFWPLNFIIEGTEIKSAFSVIKRAFSMGKATFLKAFEVLASEFLLKFIPLALSLLVLFGIFALSFSSIASSLKENPDLLLAAFMGIGGLGLLAFIFSLIFVIILSLFASSASTVTLLELYDEMKQSFLS